MKCRQKLEKITGIESRFFEKIKLTTFSQSHQEKKRPKINKIRNERGEIKTDSTDIQRSIIKHHEQLQANKLDSKEVDTFLET